MSDGLPAAGEGGDGVSEQEATAEPESPTPSAAQGEARTAPDEPAKESHAPPADQPPAEGTVTTGLAEGTVATGPSGGTATTGAADQHDAQEHEAQPETLHGCPLVDSLGAAVVHCERDAYGELMAALSKDGYELMVGVTAVDYLTHPGRPLPGGIEPERFEVVVELARVQDRARVRVRCQVPESEATLPTLFDLWAGSEAHEREVYDMYGIAFDGHPDPSRILMPEDWEGHPLRKDYASGRIPVQFKESPSGR